MSLIRPGMGTENASMLLEAVVRMTRPRTVVEIGAGDSTIALGRALDEALHDWTHDREALESPEWSERVALLDPTSIPASYQPKLITIDDFSGEGSSAMAAWDRLRETGVTEGLVQFVQQDFYTIPESDWDAWGPLDIAWVDAGTPADDIRFVTKLWDRIRPGGYLILHEPTMLTTVVHDGGTRIDTVRSPLWEELSSRRGTDYELVTFPEQHKYRQSGVGLIRKLGAGEEGIRRSSLQNELLTLGEAPVRGDLLPLGRAAAQPSPGEVVLNALRDSDARRVHAAVLLGATSIAAVTDSTKLTSKTIGKALNRLLAAGLVTSISGVLHADDDAWVHGHTPGRRDASTLPDSVVESADVLPRVAGLFSFGRDYPEDVVSGICAAVSADFARLRRKLVDDGYLTRADNVYRRVV